MNDQEKYKEKIQQIKESKPKPAKVPDQVKETFKEIDKDGNP